MRFSARLSKLESSIPIPPPVDDNERPQINFQAVCDRITAESASVASLPPAEKLAHSMDEIAKIKRKAAEPPPQEDSSKSVGYNLRVVFHKIAAQDVRRGFPNLQYGIRECEIQILRQHGYDVTELNRAHLEFAHLPWQWIHYQKPLPPDARAMVDIELFAV